ncbi:Myotubularin-related protein 14 [Araneus ventricosus]|uniref:Myotubularin-related protein 14 n=2 Tax=Araneus ventricosus TaxID=182803 RepID=A0A4Y2NQ96_ARAVE|nr:Myotubularin-related protein 14 [Araneus ventricosus]
MTNISAENIEELLALFSRKGQYDARTGEQSYEIHRKCEELFEKDYVCCKIENEKGSLSTNYPSQIIVPTDERSFSSKDSDSSKGTPCSTNNFDATKYKEIANKSNLARCRTRFPVPVILYKGKFVCRSATLACGGEMLWRDMSVCIFNTTTSESEEKSAPISRNGPLFTELRSQDIKLLKELSVSYICDLMVENKKVKYGLKVSSSEKIDKENRYCDFKIVQLPYPGNWYICYSFINSLMNLSAVARPSVHLLKLF